MATVVTKTIGPTGDYTTLAAWIADCPIDLVAADIVWRGEVQNTELTGTTTLLTISGLTTDATRYVELTAAEGASFADNANVRTNALRYNAANGAAIRSSVTWAQPISCNQPYTRISRLQIKATATGSGAYPALKAFGNGVDVDQCVIEAASSQGITSENGGSLTMSGTGVVRNSAVIALQTESASGIARLDIGGNAYNCAFMALNATVTAGIRGSYATSTIRNCVFGGVTAVFSGTSTFNATTCATDCATLPSGFIAVAMADVFESVTPGSHDLRLKSGSPLIDVGTTDTTYAAKDVSGLTRSGLWDIGPWEYSSGGPTDATADGGTGTGTGSGTGGDATGEAGGDATATGGTGTGAGSGTGGDATGGASGSFTSSPMYSSGILQVSVALDWTWYPGAIGAAPTAALVYGSGATSAEGTLTMTGLPVGTGFLLAETADGAIYYEAGTVA